MMIVFSISSKDSYSFDDMGWDRDGLSRGVPSRNSCRMVEAKKIISDDHPFDDNFWQFRSDDLLNELV